MIFRPLEMVSELFPEPKVLDAPHHTKRFTESGFILNLENHRVVKVLRKVLFLVIMRSQ